MKHHLFVATVQHHTEPEARALPESAGLPYLGIWRMTHVDSLVHLFGEVDPARLRLAGWTPEPDRKADEA